MKKLIRRKEIKKNERSFGAQESEVSRQWKNRNRRRKNIIQLMKHNNAGKTIEETHLLYKSSAQKVSCSLLCRF